MDCPVDGTTLQMTDRSGVEIDYCPQCRGVWLDRGELDKIIERSSRFVETEVDTYRREGKSYKPRKKKHPLAELFDF